MKKKSALDELVLQGQVGEDEEQSESSGWSAGAGGGMGLLPACASFIFLIKAVGAVKKEPRDTGIGDWASNKEVNKKKREERRKQPEELPCQTFTLNLTHLPLGGPDEDLLSGLHLLLRPWNDSSCCWEATGASVAEWI